MKIVFSLANSAYPDEMGLHCLPKYPFKGFQYKGLKYNEESSVLKKDNFFRYIRNIDVSYIWNSAL